jgi:hypothetical protein
MQPVKICSKVAALACVLSVVACGGEDPAERPVSTASALENPIAACQAELSMCQRGPGGGGCEQEMRTCLENYVQWLAAVREGIAQCRTQAGLCVSNGGSPMTCRQGYDSCIDALRRGDGDTGGDDAGVAEDDAGTAGVSGSAGRGGRGPRGGAGGSSGGAAGASGRGGRGFPGFPGGGFPGGNAGQGFPGAGGQGLPGLPGLPGGNGGPGLPGLPGFPGGGNAGSTAAAGSGGSAAPGRPGPGLPGIGPGGAPGVAPEAQCMQKLAQCMQSGNDLAECANEARECLRQDPISALFIH